MNDMGISPGKVHLIWQGWFPQISSWLLRGTLDSQPFPDWAAVEAPLTNEQMIKYLKILDCIFPYLSTKLTGLVVTDIWVALNFLWSCNVRFAFLVYNLNDVIFENSCMKFASPLVSYVCLFVCLFVWSAVHQWTSAPNQHHLQFPSVRRHIQYP